MYLFVYCSSFKEFRGVFKLALSVHRRSVPQPPVDTVPTDIEIHGGSPQRTSSHVWRFSEACGGLRLRTASMASKVPLRGF